MRNYWYRTHCQISNTDKNMYKTSKFQKSHAPPTQVVARSTYCIQKKSHKIHTLYHHILHLAIWRFHYHQCCFWLLLSLSLLLSLTFCCSGAIILLSKHAIIVIFKINHWCNRCDVLGLEGCLPMSHHLLLLLIIIFVTSFCSLSKIFRLYRQQYCSAIIVVIVFRT